MTVTGRNDKQAHICMEDRTGDLKSNWGSNNYLRFPSKADSQPGTLDASLNVFDFYTFRLIILCRWEFYKAETSRSLTQLPRVMVWEISRRTRNMTYAQGVGRHTQAEVEQLLEEDLTAVSNFLGDVLLCMVLRRF